MAAAQGPAAGAAEPSLLTGQEDSYDGLIVDEASVPASPAEFRTALDASLAAWRQVRRARWVRPTDAPTGWEGAGGAGPLACNLARDRAAARILSLAPAAQRGYRGIWLKIPAAKSHVIGHAVDSGFEFHHAEKVLQQPHSALARLPAGR